MGAGVYRRPSRIAHYHRRRRWSQGRVTSGVNLYLRSTAADAEVTVGTGTKWRADWNPGSSATHLNKNSVAGPTAPLQATDGAAGVDGTAVAFYSPPLQAVTIAGAITVSLWCRENANANNIGPTIRIERCSADGTVLSTIVDETFNHLAGEMANTAGGASDTISVLLTSVVDTALADGDRLRITLWIDDSVSQGGTGNMGSGGQGEFWVNGPVGSQGQARLAFTETLAEYFPVGGNVVQIGQAVETDTASALTRTKSRTLGQAQETDTGQVLGRSKARAIAQVQETDTAQSVSRSKTRSLGLAVEVDTASAFGAPIVLGQAVESDTAFAVTRSKARGVGQAAETDTATVLGRTKTKSVGQANESDTASALARSKTRTLAQALEADTATALARVKSGLLGQATEADTAGALTRTKLRALAQALETDSATGLARAKRRALGQAQETDIAFSMATGTTVILGQAVETDTALAFGRAKSRAVGQAQETDSAQALARSKQRAVGQAAEVDTAGQLVRVKLRAILQATETDSALALARAKTRTVGQAAEVDTAMPVTVEGAVEFVPGTMTHVTVPAPTMTAAAASSATMVAATPPAVATMTGA